MDIEDIDIPNPWIPIKALREAADPKSSLRATHRKTASSPPSTPTSQLYKSIGKLSSACSSINLHTRYNTATIDSFNHIQAEIDNFKTESKFSDLVRRLNEEILILSNQLRQSNEIISNLTQRLNDQSKRHVMQLQALQERHEQKMRKNKKDFEFYLSQLTEKFLPDKQNLEKSSELNKILKEEIESNSLEFQRQIDWLKQFCIKVITEIKAKYDEDLIRIRAKCKDKIIRAKEKLRLSGTVDDDSTLVYLSDEVSEEQSQKFNLYQ